MKVVRNIVEGVKFTFTTMVRSVLVAAWRKSVTQIYRLMHTSLIKQYDKQNHIN